MRHLLLGASLLPLLFTACGGGDPAGPGGGSTTSSSSTGTSAEPPPATADQLCSRVTPGPAGARAIPVDLSAAHAGVRFFGAVEAYSQADQALAAALDAPDALTKPDLAPYAAALAGVVCALPASDAQLGPVKVEVSGDVAIIHPGTGGIEIPAGVKAIAVDLRDLPAVPGVRAAIEGAIAEALTLIVPGARSKVREQIGMTDEVFSATNVYLNTTHTYTEDAIDSMNGPTYPLAVLTGPAMPPEAADVAIRLRLTNTAFIFGEDVLAGVAEMRWQGVGSTGVAYRWQELLSIANRGVPDVIPADRRSYSPEALLADLAAIGAPPDIADGGKTRSHLVPMSPFKDMQPATITLGTARAALVVAHGALREFFPYFSVVGDTIDARLVETIDALGATAPDRMTTLNALRRFGNAISDGHQFDFDYAPPTTAGYLPILVEDIAGEPVVRRSLAVGIAPGDTITSIGGVPAAQWYATELARTSAATDGYRFNIATRRYTTLTGPIQLGLRDPDGNEKTIMFQPQPLSDWTALGFAPSARSAGPLTDLGAPDLYYINLDGGVLTSTADYDAALTAAASAKGLVIDMRGYPGIDHYHVAETLIQSGFSSPVFHVPHYRGPDVESFDDDTTQLSPVASPSFSGPIVLLVGHATVSAAENFSIMLVDAQRVKVMGRRSAGTNGNITGVQLPGSFGFSFTGMEVLHADAAMSQFHGIGIVPDKETVLTAKAFRDGHDPELEEAVAWLSMP
jgi:hypothetical protein